MRCSRAIHDPGSYQAFQHFIRTRRGTSRRCGVGSSAHSRRRGVLILDDTGFPETGHAFGGRAAADSGTLGKIGNCQIAVTAALWTGGARVAARRRVVPAASVVTTERRHQARIPARVRFQEKWRLALTLLNRVRRAGIDVELVTADAGYGDILEFRTGLEQRQLPYILGISGQFAVWIGRPPADLGPSTRAVTARASAPRRWRRGRRSNPRARGGASRGATVHDAPGGRASSRCA